MEKQDIADTLLVGVDFTRGREVGVLIVGRKNEKKLLRS